MEAYVLWLTNRLLFCRRRFLQEAMEAIERGTMGTTVTEEQYVVDGAMGRWVGRAISHVGFNILFVGREMGATCLARSLAPTNFSFSFLWPIAEIDDHFPRV